MATVEMIMPKMGESVMEGTVLTWLKGVGESIDEDESLLEVATDKVDTEIPSTHAGVLKEILANEGDVVEVGSTIAIIEVEAASALPANGEVAQEKPKDPVEQAEEFLETALFNASINGAAAQGDTTGSEEAASRFYSPLVKSMAKEEGITLGELETVVGTGKQGRVTKNDMLAFIESRKASSTSGSGTASVSKAPAASGSVPVVLSGGDEIIEMDRMRKMIAERMVSSKQTSPHVTSFVEADVSKVVAWRAKAKQTFLAREGEKLTFTPILIEAIVKAIKDFPMINVQVDGDKIVKKGAVNIGMATALPSGNLIVPVIHHADQLSLVGLTKKVNDLAKRARENKLKPDELQGGTYTVSNVGSFGNVMGTPIIVQPQVAIMALGAIQKKPSVIETPEGDMIGIRSKMYLSHSYDHRVVDGALGGMFVRKVGDYLESFDLDRDI